MVGVVGGRSSSDKRRRRLHRVRGALLGVAVVTVLFPIRAHRPSSLEND